MSVRSDHPVLDAARVSPRLWIGSRPPADHEPSLRDCGFDTLVLCAEEYQPPARAFPGTRVIRAPFDDDHDRLTPEQLAVAIRGAEKTHAAHEAGSTCLVTCMAGRNRSGLVSALAMASLTGMAPSEAGQLVRRRRGPGALSNPVFRGVLARMAVTPSGRQHALPCELCDNRPITRRYHEDAISWAADCKTCRVPMVVYREHGVLPPDWHMHHMIETLRLCGRPGRRYAIDAVMRSIPTHWHAHLREVS